MNQIAEQLGEPYFLTLAQMNMGVEVTLEEFANTSMQIVEQSGVDFYSFYEDDTMEMTNRIPAGREDNSRSKRYLMREIATLVRQKIPFTVRGDVPASAFPRQYKAESLDISLHLSHSRYGSPMLLGILTSTNASESFAVFEGMNADLHTAPGPFARNGDTQTERPFLRTQIDDLGHFVFRDVPEGEYVLVLHLSGREVIIEELAIRLL